MSVNKHFFKQEEQMFKCSIFTVQYFFASHLPCIIHPDKSLGYLMSFIWHNDCTSSKVRYPAHQMPVNARQWCNNLSEVATSGEEC